MRRALAARGSPAPPRLPGRPGSRARAGDAAAGRLPAAVAAVGLVGALAGEHHLHVTRAKRELEQRGRAPDPARLLEAGYAAPQLAQGNPSAPSPCRWCSVPITRALSAAASRSSRTLPWPGSRS